MPDSKDTSGDDLPLPTGHNTDACPDLGNREVNPISHTQDITSPASFAAVPLAKTWQPYTPEELANQFPGYRIESLIGRGGMGAVYRATQLSLNRIVAVKILPRELSDSDPAFAARFEREAQAMARLEHPNIATVYDYGIAAAGFHYLVMEFVDGMDFHHWIRSGELNEINAIAAVCQVCDALYYAHNCGFIHRDIKPANLFISRLGTIKVGDFGLTKIVEPASQLDGGETGPPLLNYPAISLTGAGMGTPVYSAPEQIDGRPVDHRADIYSLGVTLYEMLTSELPRGHFPLPSERASVNVILDEVVLKAMESDRENRYSDVHEMRIRLDLVLTAGKERTVLPDKQNYSSRVRAGLLLGLKISATLLILVAALLYLFAPNSEPEESAAGPAPVIIYEKIQVVEGSSNEAAIPLAPNPAKNTASQSIDVFKRMLKGESISPEQAQEEIFGSQKAMISSGTEVKILDQQATPEKSGFGALGDQLLSMTRVEVLSGPHTGKTGWVSSNLIKVRRVPKTEN